MKTFIHVNRNTMASNLKHGTDKPAISVRQGGSIEYVHDVVIDGPSRILSSGTEPLLSCGARVVIETDAPVRGELR